MKALVVQHMINEGMGLLRTVLEDKGWQLDIRCMEEGEGLPENLDHHDSMLIMGGPMGAYEWKKYPYLIKVQDLIRKAVCWHVPTLGICLGAQLIAQALGGRVTRNPVKEIGWYPLTLTEYGRQSLLFKGLDPDFMFFEWHEDTFTLPEKGRWLVRGKTCLNQAFSIDDYIWGLQFHPEVTREMIQQWLMAGSEEVEEFGGRSEARIILERNEIVWEQNQESRDKLLDNIESILRCARIEAKS